MIPAAAGRVGALLVNLGSPASPTVADVRRYLREFLGDPFVLDVPGPVRRLLLEGVILPFRPRRSARAYRQIWTDAGSPLVVHGRALRDAVAERLGDEHPVELAMRYGEPAIGNALARLREAGVDRIVAVPLFPQYAAATSGSVRARLESERARRAPDTPLAVVGAFYDDPRFVAAFAAVARPELDGFAPDRVLMSFHGLPERQVRRADASGRHCLASDGCCDAIGAENRDCYRAQSFATARALARALSLSDDAYGVAFQSRLGPVRWIGPETQAVLDELVAAGVRRVAVICPAFVADCLETLEEIGLRARERWLAAGGEALHLVPSLNAHPRWADAVAGFVADAATQSAR